jgi:branched-chain amino acid transport system substrate-binding protein
MKSNSKIITVIVAVICAAVIVGLLLFNSKKKDQNEIEIGVIAPLTGQIASIGNTFLKGLEMGVRDANLKGGAQLKLIVEDCHSNPKDANSAYRKLKGQGVKYYAAFGGQFVAGFATETNNSDEILFASATPNSTLQKMTNRCFRIFPTVDMMTDKICEYIDSCNFNKIAIVYMQFEAYSMYYENLIPKLKNKGKDVVFTESYDPANRDFKSIINKLANVPVDILYTAGAGESSSLLTRQLFSNPQTEKIPVIGDMNFSNPDNLKIIGQVKAPICAVDNYISPIFSAQYKEQYGQNPDSYALYGYMIAFLIKQALDSMGNGYTTNDVFEYIRTHTFETAGGTISFDLKTREPNLQLIFKETLPNE